MIPSDILNSKWFRENLDNIPSPDINYRSFEPIDSIRVTMPYYDDDILVIAIHFLMDGTVNFYFADDSFHTITNNQNVKLIIWQHPETI